jgi:nucleoside-diphosphate-sugar epimerase
MGSEKLHLVILGGTGFVGSAIMRRLALLPPGSIEARVLVRSVKGKSLSHFPDVTVIEGSLPDIPPSLFPKEPHVVVHLATKQIDHDRSGYTYNNVLGTRSLLRMLPASTMGLIYASSTSVYGQGPHEGVRERDARLDPKTDLAKSRAAAESAIISAMSDRRKSAVILRPRFILGLEDRYTLPAIIKMVKAGFLIGSGQQAYSVIDVDDYAEIIVRLARRIAATDETRDGTRLCMPANGFPAPGNDFEPCRCPINRLLHTQPSNGERCFVSYVGWTKQIPATAGRCVSTDSVSTYNRYGGRCSVSYVGWTKQIPATAGRCESTDSVSACNRYGGRCSVSACNRYGERCSVSHAGWTKYRSPQLRGQLVKSPFPYPLSPSGGEGRVRGKGFREFMETCTKQIPATAGRCVSTDSVSACNRYGRQICTPFHVGYQQPLSLSVIVNSICETLNIAHPKRTLPAPAWRQIARLLRLLPLDRAVSLSTRLELIGFSHFFDVSALTAEIGPGITEKDPVQVLSEALKRLETSRVEGVAG